MLVYFAAVGDTSGSGWTNLLLVSSSVLSFAFGSIYVAITVSFEFVLIVSYKNSLNDMQFCAAWLKILEWPAVLLKMKRLT